VEGGGALNSIVLGVGTIGFAVLGWWVANLNRAAAARHEEANRIGMAQRARIFARLMRPFACLLAALGVLTLIGGLARL
jgi:hypothetical protein